MSQTTTDIAIFRCYIMYYKTILRLSSIYSNSLSSLQTQVPRCRLSVTSHIIDHNKLPDTCPRIVVRFASVNTDAQPFTRILPQDFGPIVEPKILHLLTLTSLSVDVLSTSVTDTPKNLNKICSLSVIDDKERELPFYRLMTQKELDESREKAKLHILKLMEMPAFLRKRPLFGSWIDEEELDHLFPDHVGGRSLAIESYAVNPHVFVDISKEPSLLHRPHTLKDIPCPETESSNPLANPLYRSVVVREVDGRLRDATGPERDRLLQVYFPKPRRELELPASLRGENLDLAAKYYDPISGLPHVLTPGQLDNLLENCCYLQLMDALHHQCDADSEIYIELHLAISRHLVKNNNFDYLRDTKYFGGVVWCCLTGHLDYLDPISKLLGKFIKLKQHHSFEALFQLICIVVKNMEYASIQDVQSVFALNDSNDKSTAIYNFIKEHNIVKTDIEFEDLQNMYFLPSSDIVI